MIPSISYLYDSPFELKSQSMNPLLLSLSNPFARGKSTCCNKSSAKSPLNVATVRKVDSASSGGSLLKRFSADFMEVTINEWNGLIWKDSHRYSCGRIAGILCLIKWVSWKYRSYQSWWTFKLSVNMIDYRKWIQFCIELFILITSGYFYYRMNCRLTSIELSEIGAQNTCWSNLRHSHLINGKMY